MDLDLDLSDAVMHSQRDSAISGSQQVASSTLPTRNATSDDEKNRKIALHHANLIEQRKRIEASVLDSTIKLIDFPLSPNADPERPTKDDARAVKQHLRLFQPNDYDELITERNIEKQCGYVLCPRPHKPVGRIGKFTILQKGRDLQVVDTKDVMRWCSEECTKRAMYLRVQLSETPAWERLEESKLELPGEDPDLAVGDAPNPNVDRDAVAKVAEDLKKLALERGNPTADKLMTDVREKLSSIGLEGS